MYYYLIEELVNEAKKDRYSDLDFNKIIEDNNLCYEIALPGFKKDDVKIEVKTGDRDVITIEAYKQKSDKKYTVLSIKKHHNFELVVDTKVYDLQKVTAKMEDGILYLTIGKLDEKIPKKSEIKID